MPSLLREENICVGKEQQEILEVEHDILPDVALAKSGRNSTPLSIVHFRHLKLIKNDNASLEFIFGTHIFYDCAF